MEHRKLRLRQADTGPSKGRNPKLVYYWRLSDELGDGPKTKAQLRMLNAALVKDGAEPFYVVED
jgi:hypothetical protein